MTHDEPLVIPLTVEYLSVWQRYEARKAAFLAANPAATPEQYEEACQRAANEVGI